MTQLYLITPPQFELARFTDRLKSAFDGGKVAILQVRMKTLAVETAPVEDIKRAAEALLPVCQSYNVPCIINDNAEVARAAGADGVHIGEDQDGTIAAARAALGPDKIIGYSCYASLERAEYAEQEGVNYVAFGAFYPTQTKEPKGRPTPDILTEWKERNPKHSLTQRDARNETHRNVSVYDNTCGFEHRSDAAAQSTSRMYALPCVAIGGITPANAAPLIEAGADYLAVVSYVWNHPDGPEEAVRMLIAAQQPNKDSKTCSISLV